MSEPVGLEQARVPLLNEPAERNRPVVYAVIMAGGKGERLWPKSRRNRPKQFLQIFGEGTLLQQAYRRASLITSPERILLVTAAEYRGLVLEQLPGIEPHQVIVEPVGRDTAPCIGLAAVYIAHAASNQEALMAVLPSDHAIWDEARFAQTLLRAADLAAGGDCLVTIGIRPTRPETGYGYIQCGEPLAGPGQTLGGQPVPGAMRARRFHEKPDSDAAQRFLREGGYLWNSGMFVWTVSAIRRALAHHLPELHEGLERIAAALGTPQAEAVLEAEFPSLPRISIDYGVMEKADNVLVVPADFGWDDLGTWAAMPRVGQADDQGNVVAGQAVLIDSRDCIIDGGRRLVVGLGVERLVLIDTEDVVFVSDARCVDRLKQVVAELQARGLEAYLTDGRPADDAQGAQHAKGPDLPVITSVPGLTGLAIPASGQIRTVNKPWGREVWWAQTDKYAGKLIQVAAGQALSLQYHQNKKETLLFTSGRGRLVLGNREVMVEAGTAVTIEPGTVHRVIAETNLTFFEVSTPELDDVIRLEDRYGRASS